MASNHFQDLSPPLHPYLYSCQYQCTCMLSHVQLFVTPCTVAHRAPLSMGFPRQEYWSGLLFLIQGVFLTWGLNLHLLRLLHWRQILYHLNLQGSQPSFIKYYVFNCVQLFAPPRTVAHQAPLPMEFFRQEHGSRVPFCSPGDLPNPRIKPEFLTSPALAGGFFFFNHCISLIKPYLPTLAYIRHVIFFPPLKFHNTKNMAPSLPMNHLLSIHPDSAGASPLKWVSPDCPGRRDSFWLFYSCLY